MPSTKQPLWLGSKELEPQPESDEFVEDSSGLTLTLVYRGPFTVALNRKPVRGQAVAGYNEALRVERTNVRREHGGRGVLVVTLRAEFAEGEGEIGPSNPPIYEVEWVQHELAMETNKFFTEGEGALSSTQIAAVKKAAESRSPLTGGLAENPKALALWARLANGRTTYIDPRPIARVTTESWKKPESTPMGKRGAPPGFPGLPPDYEWLGTADRATKTGRGGKWERQQEWTGATIWDPLIYPEA